jgi:predicted naringenin-chalcone synthase
MGAIIAGIGTAVPRHRISQVDAAEIAKRYACTPAGQERKFLALYHRVGVDGRNCVVLDASAGPLESRQSFYETTVPTTRDRMRKYEEEAGLLALTAARAALQEASIAADRVTHLVTVSCSGFYAPGFDITLIKHLPLSREVARTHVGFMGCHGALNGLRVASAFLDADASSYVLLCALELCSLHYQYGWSSDKIVTNALFADGAAAVVAMDAEPTMSRSRYRIVASGSVVIDNSEDAMTWRIGDQGFEMTLSPRVPSLICQHLHPWLESWLAQQKLTFGDIHSWAIHPGGPRILSAVCEAIGLNRQALEPSHQVLSEHGNMSSPTMLFILDRLRKSKAPSPCVAIAFGPGLTVEAVLLA